VRGEVKHGGTYISISTIVFRKSSSFLYGLFWKQIKMSDDLFPQALMDSMILKTDQAQKGGGYKCCSIPIRFSPPKFVDMSQTRARDQDSRLESET
jgi:hypothetical protein